MFAVCMALAGCTVDRQLVRAANALDRDLQSGATRRIEARVHPSLMSAQGVEGPGLPDGEGIGRVSVVQVTTMMELAPGVALPMVWTADGWKFDADLSELFPDGSPRDALRSFLRALDLERWEIVAGFAPRRFREELTPDAVRRAWTGGPESSELQLARDFLRAGLSGPLFSDAHSATLMLAGDRAAHLEREGAHWVVVDI